MTDTTAAPSWLDRLPPTLQALRLPVFRMLWLAWLAANLTMWMNDVAAAWLMTQLTDSAVMVALVSAASTLPVFLLGLPSGALADIVDRRRWFAATQLWVASVAVLLAILSMADGLDAHLLLALTFANGIGLAMRWPVFAAIVPEIVPRDRLSPALALQALAMNISRVIGPVFAGALLAASGSTSVFVLNALLSLAAFVQVLRWRSPPRVSTLPGERFVGAMRVGLQHVLQSPRMKAVLVRVFLFFLQSTALTALLPLVAKQLGGDAGSFTLLVSSMGVGAVVAALTVPQLRERISHDTIAQAGTLVVVAATVVVAWAPVLWVAALALVVAGMAWISTANTMTMSAQMALPNWVRARGMAVYQMGLMGGSAAGAALWGQVAGRFDIRTALMTASAAGLIALLATRRLRLQPDGAHGEDLSPAPARPVPTPAIDFEPEQGPVMVTVEYLVDPARAQDFNAVMDLTRLARLRQGALSWGLFRDTAQPGRYIEYFVDENWTEHLRRMERFTAADIGLREQRLAFHTGPAQPRVTRYLAEDLGRDAAGRG
ncbi:MFS transporter [Sphaerotilus mobilis]|uniref:Putative MFS family arabinose efflux permease n=1 Tax=Sphaerotilus mobilis TaxID=47994 RepID=A0A4Q7LTN3_9BURK|nr:MFS transporter [Sphaerotilus mobilis]RZS57179.1 putative MFS family arabinose efflux permease [Sphaerotilus mobilis]